MIVSVNGYGSTGSSACVNLLQDYSNVNSVPGEFRFFQDPDGLLDLCFNLTENWGWVRSDAFVRRFIRYTNILARHPKPWQVGSGLDNYFEHRFLEYRDEFLDKIVAAKWDGYWFYHDYHDANTLEIFIERLKRVTRRIGVSKPKIRKLTKKRKMYYVDPTKDIWLHAEHFFAKLVDLKINRENEIVLFDQLCMPYHLEQLDKIIPSAKSIIVDRDPRDVYIDALTYNAYPITDDINTFINFYKSSREYRSTHLKPNCLSIKFEDLIYQFDTTRKLIEEFLNIDPKRYAKNIFDPNVSIRNTKTFLKPENLHLGQDIRQIENQLEDYLYEFR